MTRLPGLALAALLGALALLLAPDWATRAFLLTGMALGAAAVVLPGARGKSGATTPAGLPRDPPAAGRDGLAALDALHDPVIALTRRANVAFANPAASAAFPALRPGQPLSFFLRDPVVLAAVAQVLDRGGEAEAPLVERVPVDRAFDCRIIAIRKDRPPAQGEAVAVLVMTDVSAQRAVETMRVDFVANASHELRTPLASILGFVETLQGPARNDAAARERFLAIIATQARRMSRLVDDLLSLSRIELKESQMPTGVVELDALVAETVAALSELARERGVVLNLARPGGPVPVQGARDELLSVFDNLIENAIKYGKAGGRVDIAVAGHADIGEAQVTVRDYGPGIAAIHVPRLTERFYRVDNAASRAEGGTGLGLALVKHTLIRHRGRLAIESAAGAGATFRVILPLPVAVSGTAAPKT